MDLLDHFFLLSDAYASLAGLSESTVSNRVFNGGNRIRDLRAGNTDVGVYRVKEAIRWFDTNWPEGAEWPTDVPRPSRSAPTTQTASCQAAAQAPEAA